jgi:predicted ATPase/transcriptional regulator with XRE-family HTH domain
MSGQIMEEQPPPVTFGEWLKRRRKALDLTQDELAQRAGCSVGALRKIEGGERRPSKQLAELLAGALEIPSEDRQTFIRVARGDLNLERLPRPSRESKAPFTNERSPQASQFAVPHQAARIPAPPFVRIPSPVTPLIGRGSEIAALERLFSDPDCRLLTLTGIGGIGKTRLAIEFATQRVSAFPGGVSYIPLASAKSPDEVVPAIAEVLDFGFSGPVDPKGQLLRYLSSANKQETLLILDGLEHLLALAPKQDGGPGVAELVSEILQGVPHARILGTSRERLNIHGEWTYELYGLAVPPADFAGRLEEYSSAALFVKSAQRVRPDFKTSLDDQASLVQICQTVEGVPLAIELAAAWAGMLSCQEIAQEISSNMDFLRTSMRDVPERHRSIRATFDHSWSLLSEEERRVLCRLSVFHGGFDRTAADQIAGATLPLLASLSAKSLVRRTESGRYDLHEVIRQYSSSHLRDHPRSVEAYERHCKYYLAFLQDREKSLKGAAQQDALRQLTGEIDNIRAAWAWAVNHDKHDELGGAARAFGWYFEIVGLYREGIEQLGLLERVLKAKPRDQGWDRVLGLALIHQALLYLRTGDFNHARSLYEESVGILRQNGDPSLLADALVFLGIILHMHGEYARATSLFEEGLVLARQSNDRWFEALAVYNLGYMASLMGRYAEGYEQMLDGLDLWRVLGDPHAIAMGLNFLVRTLSQLGRFQEARAFMRESIALCEQAKNRWGMGTAYRFLGLACLAEGQLTEAQAHLRKSLDIFGENFIGWDIARSLTYLGDAIRLSGDLAGARPVYCDALRLSVETRTVPIALDALVGLASIGAQSGAPEQALMLSCFVLDHPSGEEETKFRARQIMDSLVAELRPEQVEAERVAAQSAVLELLAQETLEINRISD